MAISLCVDEKQRIPPSSHNLGIPNTPSFSICLHPQKNIHRRGRIEETPKLITPELRVGGACLSRNRLSSRPWSFSAFHADPCPDFRMFRLVIIEWMAFVRGKRTCSNCRIRSRYDRFRWPLKFEWFTWVVVLFVEEKKQNVFGEW